MDVMHDLVIRAATIVDGTGGPVTQGDVAVDDGRITDVAAPGKLDDAGATRTVDADGLLVTPGFVDLHTHYDGQVTWDPLLSPSCWHGVTTVVMGNCGVGFAPVAPDRHEWRIGLMDGVEDIPGAATSVTRPSSTATSAGRASAPVPSTSVPPRITSSCMVPPRQEAVPPIIA